MHHAHKKLFLHAGDFCFDSEGTHLHTLLGSCVSITLWHETLHIGGMCHFALPQKKEKNGRRGLNARYADDCMKLFKRAASKFGTQVSEYQAKVFGGGNMYDKVPVRGLSRIERLPVGEKNSAAAFNLLLAEGVNIAVAHVGEFGYRRIIFDISTGDVWVRFTPAKNVPGDVRSLNGRK